MMHHIDLMQQCDDALDVFCVGFPNHGAKLQKKAEMQKQSAKIIEGFADCLKNITIFVDIIMRTLLK